jgi:hypothetical protein
MNDDGDWWVAVEDAASFRAARASVTGCLSYTVPADGTLVYAGIETATVCDTHDADAAATSCTPECARTTPCYHFRENRKW